MNKTFCILPWVHTHLKPNGDMHLCSRKSIPIGNIFESNMTDLFNSEKMNYVRKKMTDGEEVVGCEKCYHLEKIGSFSLRLFSNWYFKKLLVENKVEEWGDDLYGVGERDVDINTDWLTELKPIINRGPEIDWLGIHASNVCNLSCRGCYSMLSSKWKKDEKKLGINPYPLYDKDLNEFNIDFKKTKLITMFGGEPLYMKQNDQLMDSLIKEDTVEETILQYYTNGTILPNTKTLDVWKKLKKLQLFISIDAYGTENDYFRNGSDWKTVEKNVLKFIDYANQYSWELGTNTLINIYNIDRLEVLHNWLLDIGIKEEKIVYNLAIYPQELDIRNLPEDYKKQLIEKVKKTPLHKDLIKLVVEQLKSEPNISFIATKGFSNKLDELRNQTNPFEPLKVFMND